jgi:hypothetical protein
MGRWSVSVVANGDRVLSREEIVELADAVAEHGGIASGIGTTSFGAQLIVRAASSDDAVERAVAAFERAAQRAGMPAWPVSRAEAISEEFDIGDNG